MELLAKIVNGWKPLTICAKSSFSDVTLNMDFNEGFLKKMSKKMRPHAVFPSHKNFIEIIFHFSNNLKPELKKSWTADIILCGMPPSEMGGVLGENLKSIGEGHKFWFLGGLFYRGGKEFVGKMQNCIITIPNLVSFVQFKTWKTSMEKCYFK